MTALRPLLLLVMLAGCAAPQSEHSIAPDTSAGDTEQRTRARVHTELAAGYFGVGNLNIALEEAMIATRADPTYGPAFNLLGMIYSGLKEDRLAEQNFEIAVKLNPLDSDANNNYGSFLCERKREDEALRYFLAALRNPLYQTPERSYVNAGICSRRKGDIAAAQDYLQRALQARPELPSALYQLADMAFAGGDAEGARGYLLRLAKVVPNPNAETLWLGVRIARRLGDSNGAASYAQRLRRNFPQSRETRLLTAGQFE